MPASSIWSVDRPPLTPRISGLTCAPAFAASIEIVTRSTGDDDEHAVTTAAKVTIVITVAQRCGADIRRAAPIPTSVWERLRTAGARTGRTARSLRTRRTTGPRRQPAGC